MSNIKKTHLSESSDQEINLNHEGNISLLLFIFCFYYFYNSIVYKYIVGTFYIEKKSKL